MIQQSKNAKAIYVLTLGAVAFVNLVVAVLAVSTVIPLAVSYAIYVISLVVCIAVARGITRLRESRSPRE